MRTGRRKAVGAKVICYRTLPILMTYPLTEDTHERELFDAYPLLARIHEGIGDCHWDTPAFRETCFAMRVPPDEVRPVFRVPYAELASALLAGCAERFGKEEMTMEAPIGRTTAIIYDLLDLMREDLRPNPSLLNRVREDWPKVAPDRLPHAEDLTRLVHSDELLRIGEAQHRANDTHGREAKTSSLEPQVQVYLGVQLLTPGPETFDNMVLRPVGCRVKNYLHRNQAVVTVNLADALCSKGRTTSILRTS